MLKEIICNKKVLAIGVSGIALIGAGVWLVKRKFCKSPYCPIPILLEKVAAKYGMEAACELLDSLKDGRAKGIELYEDEFDEDYYEDEDADDEYLSCLWDDELCDNGDLQAETPIKQPHGGFNV